jgi:hypothetical protein
MEDVIRYLDRMRETAYPQGIGGPLTADEVLTELGRNFAHTLPTNRKKAWNDVVMMLMTNLAVLRNENCSALRDIINICRDIDDTMGGGGRNETPTGEPLDEIGKGWVMPDVETNGTPSNG